MDVVKCKKCNHFYDGDKYSTCPFCITNDTDKLFAMKEKKADTVNETISEIMAGNENLDEDNIYTVMKSPVQQTMGVFNTVYNNDMSTTDYEVTVSIEDAESTISLARNIEEQKESALSSQLSLSEEIKNVSVYDTERNHSYYNAGDLYEKDAASSDIIQNKYVVGWLVCTKGNHWGESFKLFDGNNSIGGSSSNDIILSKEKSVSSNKHAIVTYEPRKKEFYIQPGSSHGLTYLNNVLVTSPQKIELYNSIEFGDSSFIFIPFCGEQFFWEENI